MSGLYSHTVFGEDAEGKPVQIIDVTDEQIIALVFDHELAMYCGRCSIGHAFIYHPTHGMKMVWDVLEKLEKEAMRVSEG